MSFKGEKNISLWFRDKPVYSAQKQQQGKNH